MIDNAQLSVTRKLIGLLVVTSAGFLDVYCNLLCRRLCSKCTLPHFHSQYGIYWHCGASCQIICPSIYFCNENLPQKFSFYLLKMLLFFRLICPTSRDIFFFDMKMKNESDRGNEGEAAAMKERCYSILATSEISPSAEKRRKRRKIDCGVNVAAGTFVLPAPNTREQLPRDGQ
jgi:hypothetical protein